LIIGIFHPLLNACGGAEWVAVNIINNLKRAGHRIVVLNNEKTDQQKIKSLFGKRVDADDEIILPFQMFHDGDLHNVYTDGLRALFLKTKCDVLIDTQSNALLPGADITYIHFPLMGRLTDSKSRLPPAYFHPYLLYERKEARNNKRLILANSKYTSNAVRKLAGGTSTLLYPPVSKSFYDNGDDTDGRGNIVVSLSRIAPEKRLTRIPFIARFTNKGIRFRIVGIKGSVQELQRIKESIEANQVSDRVEITTDVPREELRRILRRSKVFLHVTNGEHFGVAVAEAMASGCIPIVHDSGGPREFVPKHLRFNQLREASEKIDKAVFDWSPQESKSMTNLARSLDEDVFSAKFTEIFNSFYK